MPRLSLPACLIVACLLPLPVLADDPQPVPVVNPGSPGVSPPSLLPAETATAGPAADGAVAGSVEVEPVADPCADEHRHDRRWFDRAQGYFSQRACTPAIWFDRFFGGERSEDSASALVRVIPSLQYSDRDFTDTGVRFRARLNLPNLRERFDVVVNDDAEESDGLLQGEAQRPARANDPNRESSAALRYLVRFVEGSGADVDIGLRGQMRFFTRARYYKTWTRSPVLDWRLTQSLYFLDGDGFGETTRFEVERMQAEDVLLRWSTQATVSEKANGLELREGIQLLHQIDRNRAVNWNLAMTVKSDPVWQAQAYETSVRFRQRIFRPWFFYEVEPFIDATRQDGFRTNPGIAFRVEFWLGDTGGRTGMDELRAPASVPATSPSDGSTTVAPAASQ